LIKDDDRGRSKKSSDESQEEEKQLETKDSSENMLIDEGF
jgi:hypothetical protein